MADIDLTLDELQAGVSLEAGKHYRIRLIRPVLSRLVGEIFDSNRTFLLPRAARALLAFSRALLSFGSGSVAVVSHMDALDDPQHGKLSLERAELVVAFLIKDVAKWVAQFGEDLPQEKRWGTGEHQTMLAALPAFRGKPPDETPVIWFQRQHADSLVLDGILGPKTQAKLIEQYMLLGGDAGTSAEREFEFVAHGCQAHFPLKLSVEELNPTPAPDFSGSVNRRIELFAVRGTKPISPPLSNRISDAKDISYARWLAQSKIARNDFVGPSAAVTVTLVELPDVLFNHDSALPCLDDNENLLHGLTHAYLHFMANSDQELLVVGHTDTSGEPTLNYPLSELRAAAVLAILTNDENGVDPFFRTELKAMPQYAAECKTQNVLG